MDDPVWKALDEWKAPPVSEDFDRRLYARIRKEERAPGRLAALWPFRFRPAFALAAASVMTLAVALIHAPGPARPPGQAVEAVDADRLERELDDVDMLRQLSAAPAAEVYSL